MSKEKKRMNPKCALCRCDAVGVVFGFRVCSYHLEHGEDDAPCPNCPQLKD